MDAILLGELEDKLNKMSTDVGATLNTIGTDISNIKQFVSTNNTSNKTGTLSQKLSSLIAVNDSHGMVEYATAGTRSWVCPDGVYQIFVIAFGGYGGGGGGGGGSWYYNGTGKGGSGGGSGGAAPVYQCIINVTPGNSYEVVVGNGGSGGTGGAKTTTFEKQGSNGTPGGTGEQTKFGTILVANGGAGGGAGQGGWYYYKNTVVDDVIIIGKETIDGGVGGSTVKTVNKTFYRALCVKNIDGASGNKADNVTAKDGGAGATGKSNVLGINTSGAGGKGGNTGSGRNGNGVPSATTAGTNGSVGQPGYIKIVW